MLSLMPVQKKPASPFGARLIALRKARGMTQAQLADAIGATQRVVSYYEAVAVDPGGDIVVKLAQALGVSTDELLGAKSMPRQPSPLSDPDERRLWRKFQKVRRLPEKDQRAVFRLVNSLVGAKDDD